MALEDKIISILEESPSDQYSLYRHLATAKMSEITKILAKLQKSNIIHVTRHRNSGRHYEAWPELAIQKTDGLSGQRPRSVRSGPEDRSRRTE